MTEKRTYNRVVRSRFRVIIREPNRSVERGESFEDKVSALAFIENETHSLANGTEIKMIKVNEIPLQSFKVEVVTTTSLKAC